MLIVVWPALWVINTLHDPSTLFGSRPSPVSSKQAPMEIRELTIVIGNNICTTMWYSRYNCSTQCYIIIYGLYTKYSHCSLSYHSSVDHGWPTPSTHPHTIHGSCMVSTMMPYTIGPCKPLQPGPGLPGLDKRGVAQEKWSCQGPRSCLTYGLLLLVLPVIWSVRCPSPPGDVI